MKAKATRRTFLKASSAMAGFHILPSGLLANPPNSRLCTAHIGIGGKGQSDLEQFAGHPSTEVVALCDVDRGVLTPKKNGQTQTANLFKNVPFFQDYRELLTTLGDKVDAVGIATPDHMHYPATMAAMRLGKHVYTQKPLTHNILESRHLAQTAGQKKVVTQMGIQNQSSIAYRLATHFIRSGLIGKVSKVLMWSGKNWGYDGAPYTGEDPAPPDLDWNLWLGTAPYRPYLKEKYHPKQWRRIIDFGCGTLGDMGVHIFDTPYRSLGLKPPQWVKATCRAPNHYSLPTKTIVQYGFAPTEFTTQDFTWTWRDGAHAPPRGDPHLVLPNGQRLPNQGAMFVGQEGRMLLEHTAGPRFFPRSVYDRLKKPDLERSVNHYHQWIDAILGKADTPTANFNYAASLMETILLGVVAGRFPDKTLHWDSATARVTNIDEANPFLKLQYRNF